MDCTNGSSEAPKRTIKLQTNDGLLVDVDIQVACVSQTIKQMLEDCNIEDDDPIPLANISSSVLRKVLEWAEFHKDDPPVNFDDEKEIRRTNDMGIFDSAFLKIDQSLLFDIILAANYLDIKGLLNVSCKAVANMIKGKQPEEIRTLLNIQNDFTPEEEEQIRKENDWCEEK